MANNLNFKIGSPASDMEALQSNTGTLYLTDYVVDNQDSNRLYIGTSDTIGGVKPITTPTPYHLTINMNGVKELDKYTGSENETVDLVINNDGVYQMGSEHAAVHYALCNTASDVAEKATDIMGFVLTPGARIHIKFLNTNTAETPKLNINKTGAQNINFNNKLPYLIAGNIYTFIFDGTNYALLDEYHRVDGLGGEGAEVFNHPDNIAVGDYSHAEGSRYYYDDMPEEGGTGGGGAEPISLLETNEIATTTAEKVLKQIESWEFETADGEVYQIIGSTAIGLSSHAEGIQTGAVGDGSHAEGRETGAMGQASHSEGYYTGAIGDGSHAEGYLTNAGGHYSHAENFNNEARGFSSHAEGIMTITDGDAAHAEGIDTYSGGTGTHAEGLSANAYGEGSHAEGYGTSADGVGSHSEGYYSSAEGEGAHAEGRLTNAYGYGAHAEGCGTEANSSGAHAEGGNLAEDGFTGLGDVKHSIDNSDRYTNQTIAEGVQSHAEGTQTLASGYSAHAEGYRTDANGKASHAEGGNFSGNGELVKSLTTFIIDDGTDRVEYGVNGPRAEGNGSHAEGNATFAYGFASHSEGYKTLAQGEASHAEGWNSEAKGNCSHAEGDTTQALGQSAHAEGGYTYAGGDYSHAEGYMADAGGMASHAEGGCLDEEGNVDDNVYNISLIDGTTIEVQGSLAYGIQSHAEGFNTLAYGYSSHAEGYMAVAEGKSSHAEGYQAKAKGMYSHAEGLNTQATGIASHAEGENNLASGYAAHIEGSGNLAIGVASHAEGYQTQASGAYSHASGLGTIASKEAQTVIGRYNAELPEDVASFYTPLFTIGDGIDDNNRSSIFNIFAGDGIKCSYFGDLSSSSCGITSVTTNDQIIQFAVSSSDNDKAIIYGDNRGIGLNLTSSDSRQGVTIYTANNNCSAIEVGKGISHVTISANNIDDLSLSYVEADEFRGILKGNADSATKDSNGNIISDTYVTLDTSQTITGQKTFAGNIVLTKNVNYGDTLPASGVDGQIFFIPHVDENTYEYLPLTGGIVHGSIQATEFIGNLSGIATKAKVLETPKNIQVNLSSTTSASFDGSNDITPGVNGVLSIANGGTGATSAAQALLNLGITTTAAELNILDGATIDINDNVITGDLNGTATNATNVYVNNTTAATKYYIVGSANTTTGNSALYRAMNTSGTQNQTGVYFEGTTGVLYGAAWNDYAEFRKTEEKIEPGRIVIETGKGDLVLATERLQAGAEVVSDTFGFAIGETDECQTPIAVAGRVLVYPYEDKNSYQPGDAVCSGPNGTVSKMTREEICKYPHRIIGTVSEIPDYEVWGQNDVKVNNRIWIRIR